MLAKCVMGWTGLNRGGEEVEFSEAAALDLFTRFPWIQAQCDRKAADRSNFTKG